MIIRDFTYKGVSLSDTLAGTTKIVVQNVDKDVKLRTAVYDRVNYHGARSSYTLASGRLFTISGLIFGDTRADRATGETILNNIIAPESNPSASNLGFYPLTWKDDSGNVMLANVKVYSMPQYKHETGSSIIEFSFELYSEEAFYTSNVDKNANGGYVFVGGQALGAPLPFSLDGYIGSFTVQNLGNFNAPCKIEVVGNIVAPKVQNITTGDFYGVSSTTSDFILDTRGTKAIITDAGVDVSGYRVSGSKYVSVAPGANTFVLLGSNYNADSAVTIAVTYKDTYISS